LSSGGRGKRENFRTTVIVCHILTYFHNFFCRDLPHENWVNFPEGAAREGFLEIKGMNNGNGGLRCECRSNNPWVYSW
jgi:hypothetical protein